MGRLLFLLFLLHLGLAFAAIVDCLGGEQKPERLSRTVWTLLAIFGFLGGPIAWFTYGRPGRKLQLPWQLPQPRTDLPRGPAPDDDPDFLRDLDRRQPKDPDERNNGTV
jgi:hypothetical protein